MCVFNHQGQNQGPGTWERAQGWQGEVWRLSKVRSCFLSPTASFNPTVLKDCRSEKRAARTQFVHWGPLTYNLSCLRVNTVFIMRNFSQLRYTATHSFKPIWFYSKNKKKINRWQNSGLWQHSGLWLPWFTPMSWRTPLQAADHWLPMSTSSLLLVPPLTLPRQVTHFAYLCDSRRTGPRTGPKPSRKSLVLAGWFSWLENRPVHQRPRVSPLVRVRTGGNQWMFLSCINVPPPRINKNISLVKK